MTRRLASEVFEFAPREAMAVKGRTEPVEAWLLEGALTERPRVRGGEARLVGRERELAALESALEEARDGRGLMVALVGEPGIGKSRLAHETAGRAETGGFATAWTSSRSYASAFPYHLVAQLVPQLLNGGQDGTDAALRAAGIDADEGTIERWAFHPGRCPRDAVNDGTELLDLSPAGKQRILVHALGALAPRRVGEGAVAPRPRRPPLGRSRQSRRRRGAADDHPRAAGCAPRDVPLELVARVGGPKRL